MKLGFIGVGKMGSALLGGILRSNLCPASNVLVYDTYKPAMEKCAEEFGVFAAESSSQVLADSDATVLCVKPNDVGPTLQKLDTGGQDRLIISIAAGVTLKQLEDFTKGKLRVIRVMPNTPALVGEGASAYALGEKATQADGDFVKSLLECVGTTYAVSEAQLDAVTGLSGSGPAYIFTVIEALADGGVLQGLPKSMALDLATQTVLGAAALVKQSGEHPAKLRDNVTSPGGTTIAGLAELERHGLRAALIDAVEAATERSRELGD